MIATRLAQSLGMASTAGGGRCATLIQPVKASAARDIKSFFMGSTVVKTSQDPDPLQVQQWLLQG